MDYVANNVRDFVLYFNGCFIGKPSKQGGFEVYKVHAREDSGEIALVSYDGKNKIKENWKTLVEEWQPVPTKIGMTNIGSTICYISRYPRQQVKKGFTTDSNYSFWYPHQALFDGGKLARTTIADLANAGFNNSYLEVDALCAELSSGDRIGGAISRNFGIYILPNYEDNILCYKNNNIGKVKEGVFYIAKPYIMYLDILERTFQGKKPQVIEHGNN